MGFENNLDCVYVGVGLILHLFILSLLDFKK